MDKFSQIIRNSGLLFVLLVSMSQGFHFNAFSADNRAAPPSQDEGESVNVDAIRKKYWVVGDQTKLGVVQNRMYTKAERFELGFYGGFLSGDPFWNTYDMGGLLGYHLSEHYSIKANYWKSFNSSSSARDKFLLRTGIDTNSNLVESFYSLELAIAPIYGKLNFFDVSIIYYDIHFPIGLGMMDTQNGRYLAPYLGIGNRIFLSHSFALGLDYRWVIYKEDLIEKVDPATRGKLIESRTVWSSTVHIGGFFYL